MRDDGDGRKGSDESKHVGNAANQPNGPRTLAGLTTCDLLEYPSPMQRPQLLGRWPCIQAVVRVDCTPPKPSREGPRGRALGVWLDHLGFGTAQRPNVPAVVPSRNNLRLWHARLTGSVPPSPSPTIFHID